MNTALWIEAARPKTLIATISPVFIGSFLAFLNHSFSLLTALCTLGAALSIQIATNYANDLFDFLKGADTEKRKGPRRLTQAGLISPKAMKQGLLIALSIASLLGAYLILQGGLLFSLLLAVCLVLAVLYTGGPYPLAYLGLGELFVFFFFGPLATGMTFYLQTHRFSFQAFLMGIGPGLLSTALLVINNLRDFEEDRFAHKKTLIVRFGQFFGKLEYSLLLILAPLSLLTFSELPRGFFSLLLLLAETPILYALWKYKEVPWILLLEKTGQLLLLYTLLFFLTHGL